MIESWKTKTTRQSEWFALHPKQILNQAKRVWEKAIRIGDGGMWLYYIFGICQWLPTNYRSFYDCTTIPNQDTIPNLKACKLWVEMSKISSILC